MEKYSRYPSFPPHTQRALASRSGCPTSLLAAQLPEQPSWFLVTLQEQSIQNTFQSENTQITIRHTQRVHIASKPRAEEPVTSRKCAICEEHYDDFSNISTLFKYARILLFSAIYVIACEELLIAVVVKHLQLTKDPLADRSVYIPVTFFAAIVVAWLIKRPHFFSEMNSCNNCLELSDRMVSVKVTLLFIMSVVMGIVVAFVL